MRPNPGDVIADKYRLERPLGEGGMGTVYAASNILTGKQVAIKWLKPELAPEEYVQRFMREAQVASRIEHPNVVNMFDMGRHEGALFLVMELLHGEPLSAWLDHTVPDATEFLNLMIPVLRGVHAAHRMGVVHRDLKPDNIFLCRGPYGEAREPRVLDFGISKIAESSLAPGKQQLTREGAVFGTPQYMAPEQLRNVRAADARSDVYSLGVIMYRALSGRLPYEADMLPALVLQIVEGGAPHLSHVCPDLEPDLCNVVMRAMAPAASDRFRSVAELARALESFASVRFETTGGQSWLSSSPGSGGDGDGTRSRPGRMRTPASGPASGAAAGGSPSSPAQVRTPASSPGGSSAANSRPAARVDTPASDLSLDVTRPSAEAVPTPITGLRTESRLRSRLMWIAAALLLIGLPAVGAWWFYGSQAAANVAQRPVPRPPPAPVAKPEPSPDTHTPVLSADLPALAPAAMQVPPAAPAVDDVPSAPAQAARPERRRREREPASTPSLETPAPAPLAAPSPALPAPPGAPRDPTLKSDGNPYLRR
jgi:serine/threonine protein kinase